MNGTKTIVALLIATSLSSGAQTVLPDSIQTNTTLSDTVILAKNCAVVKNATLTFSPGTTLLAKDSKQLVVKKGSIIAKGTAQKPIYFSPQSVTDTWMGVLFLDSSLSEFSYTQVTGCSSSPFLLTNKSWIKMSHGAFLANESSIFCSNSNLEMDSCIITDSKSAGIELMDSSFLILTNSSIRGSGRQGISATSGSMLKIDQSIISANNKAGLEVHDCYVDLKNTEITYNNSNEVGAGIYCTGGVLNLTHVLFSENTTTVAGGAIWASGTNLMVENSTFFQNSASDAAALNLFQSSGKINRCFFEKNTVSATTAHGADIVLVNGKPFTISNSLFSGSKGAPALYKWESSDISPLSCFNATFMNCESAIAVDSFARVILENSLIYGSAKENYRTSTSSTLIQRGNIVDSDPQMTRAEGAIHYRLQSSSPCINKGISGTAAYTSSDLDLAGNSRVADGAIDVGAYEFVGAMPIVHAVSAMPKVAIHTVGNRLILSQVTSQLRSLTLFSLNGKKLFSHDLIPTNGGPVEIALPNHIGAGVYTLQLRSGTTVETVPLILN